MDGAAVESSMGVSRGNMLSPCDGSGALELEPRLIAISLESKLGETATGDKNSEEGGA